MVGILSAAGAAVSGMEAIRKVSDTIDKLDIEGNRKDISDAAKKAAHVKEMLKGTSLVEASKPARVEPFTLVDSTLADDKITEDALNVALNAFAGFYVMAASLVTSHVNGASVVKTLDKLNPNRSPLNALVYSGESHYTATRLPRSLGQTGLEAYAEDRAFLGTKSRAQALALSEDSLELHNEAMNENDGAGKQKQDANDIVRNESLKFGKTTAKDLQDKANFAIGKMVEVSMGSGNDTVSVFINFRLSPQIVSPALLEVVLVPARNRTVKQRYHAWRAGELTLWNDIVMARDIVDHHKKVRMADTKGLRQTIDKRMSKNRAAAVVSNSGSLSMFSSIAVISKETSRRIEQGIQGKLDNFKIRNKFFEDNGLMMLMVVDRDYQMVDLYYHSVPEKSELTASSLRSNSKGTGPDLETIMGALVTKSAPSF